MARRSNQNSIRSSPSSPSIRSKSDGAGPGVRSTVMYGVFGRTRSRVSLFKFLSLFEWFVLVVLFELLFQGRMARRSNFESKFDSLESICIESIDSIEVRWRWSGCEEHCHVLVRGPRVQNEKFRSNSLPTLV